MSEWVPIEQGLPQDGSFAIFELRYPHPSFIICEMKHGRAVLLHFEAAFLFLPPGIAYPVEKYCTKWLSFPAPQDWGRMNTIRMNYEPN